MAGIADLIDQDGGHDPKRDLARNRATVGHSDGITTLRAEFVGEEAAVVAEAIATVRDELFRGYQRDHDRTPDVEVPGHATLTALAIAALCRRGLAVDDEAKHPKPDVSLILWPDMPDRGVTDDGQILSPEITRLFCCDADVTVIHLNEDGEPLNMRRKKRFATPAQRQALRVRDGGCVFPGCDAPPRHCDCHHVDEWKRDEGETHLPNMALLCRRHHGITHRKGWSMRATGGGRFEWTTPSGNVLRSQRQRQRPRQRRAPAA